MGKLIYIKDYLKNASRKLIDYIKLNKVRFIYFGIFLLTALPFFVFQLYFINKHASNVIYGEKITFLAHSLDSIMNNSLSFKELFSLNNGFIAPGTHILLALEVKTSGLENNSLSLLIPVLLLFTIIVVWLFRLNKSTELNVKQVVLNVIQGIVLSIVTFSLYSWDIIWGSLGVTTFISCLLFVISMALFKKAVNSENHFLALFISSTVVGLLSTLFFGSMYAIAFVICMTVMNTIYLVGSIKNNTKNKIFYIVGTAIYFVLFAVLLALRIFAIKDSIASPARYDLVNVLKMYLYILGYTAVGPLSSNISLYGHFIIGILFLAIFIAALYIYFKHKHYQHNILVFFMFLFSQVCTILVLISKVPAGDVLSAGAGAYYPAYMFLMLFVVIVFISYINEKVVAPVNFLKTIALVAASFLVVGVFVQQTDYIIAESKNESRRQFENQLKIDSLFYEGYDDEYLQNLYQANADDVRNCFELLDKYSLYTYSSSYHIPEESIVDNLQYTSMASGLYDYGAEERFTAKTTVLYLRGDEEYRFDLSLYNPSAFKNNAYTIYINDELVCDKVSIASGEFKLETLPLSNGINKIKIYLDTATCPKEAGISDDERTLGLLVKMDKIKREYTDNLQYTSEATGLYDYGNVERFTAKDAIFYLKIQEDRQYRLSLYNPNMYGDNDYTIYVNGVLVCDKVAIADGELKVETLSLSSGLNKIEIHLNHATCPKEAGISEETRTLGLLIKMEVIDNNP